MGCANSKQASNQTAENKAEADRWQRRKANGFRDSGLYRNLKAMKKQKKKLRHVDDPDEKRKNKIKKGAETTNQKGAEARNERVGGSPTTELNDTALMNARKNLRKAR